MRAYSIQALVAAFLGMVLTMTASAVAAGPSVTLVPHRAIYDLSLLSRKERTPVVNVRGRMVHEFNGSACEGYSVSMRWVAQMGDAQGETNIDDIRFASFEDGTSGSYDYTSVRRMNDAIIEEVKAHAERGKGGGAGVVQLAKPTDEEIALPPETVFPSGHLRSIIEHALAGDQIAEMSVYDVSDDGKQIYHTLAVIGAMRSGNGSDAIEAEPAREQLGDQHLWRVTVSYFKGTGNEDETPAFTQSFDIYETGIAAGLTLDYGELVIRGRLTELEVLDVPDCTEASDPD